MGIGACVFLFFLFSDGYFNSWHVDSAENVVVKIRTRLNACSFEVTLMYVACAMSALQEGATHDCMAPDP